MSSVTTIVILAAVALAVLVVAKRQAIAQRFRAGRGRSVEPADPMALLRQIVDDGVASIHAAKNGLEDCRALLRSVQRQVESGEREKARLESRIRAALAEGDPNQAAREYALQLAEAERQLALNREQLAQHEKTFAAFAKQVDAGQNRVLEARRKADELGVALQLSRHEKDLAQSAFDPQGLQQSAAQAEERIHQQIDRNRAAVQVAADLAGSNAAPAADQDTQREAEAAQILERFRKPAS